LLKFLLRPPLVRRALTGYRTAMSAPNPPTPPRGWLAWLKRLWSKPKPAAKKKAPRQQRLGLRGLEDRSVP